ncbi:DUF3800 domain-containing protein [Corynebacterium durum]|uniref:DUF3800 domain-containing protein n=1 Tax=Corynebacterium durum TaxID=61592 RepID=UPI0028E6D130|nr:DUF3800 domain-containing protein [Corynebacterium durum]
MAKNPALDNIYRSMPQHGYALYIDETYNRQGDDKRPPYYIIGGALIQAKHLDATRKDLREIVDGDYWHTTEALQTANGRKTAKQLLQYCADVDDTYFISHQASIKQGTMEQARRSCMKALLRRCQQDFPMLKVVVVEARQTNRDNNIDRITLRELKKEENFPQATPLLAVSPAEELLLWLPDLVAMAYRRQLTHADETSRYYDKYLQASAITLQVNDDQG